MNISHVLEQTHLRKTATLKPTDEGVPRATAIGDSRMGRKKVVRMALKGPFTAHIIGSGQVTCDGRSIVFAIAFKFRQGILLEMIMSSRV